MTPFIFGKFSTSCNKVFCYTSELHFSIVFISTFRSPASDSGSESESDLEDDWLLKAEDKAQGIVGRHKQTNQAATNSAQKEAANESSAIKDDSYKPIGELVTEDSEDDGSNAKETDPLNPEPQNS